MKWVLLGAFFTFYGNVAIERQLDPIVINRKADAIKKMIDRHTYIAMGISVAVGLHQTYFLLPTLRPILGTVKEFFGCERGSLVEPAMQNVSYEHIGFFAGVAKGFKNTFMTAEGWKEIFTIGCSQVATYAILQKVDATFRHPDSLRWYIYAHVPYVKTVKSMHEMLEQLQSGECDQSKIDYCHESLRASCDRLVGYGEDVCAYMTYKSTLLKAMQREMAERTIAHVKTLHGNVLTKIDNALCVDPINYVDVKRLITLYQKEMTFYRKSFAVIEHESKEAEESVAV